MVALPDRGPVLTKPDFVRRYMAGEFGNRPQSWDTWEQYEASGYVGNIGCRCRDRSNPLGMYNSPPETVRAFVDSIDVPESNLYFYEAPPDERRPLQGELRWWDRGPELYYDFGSGLTMRPGLRANGRQVRGAASTAILRSFLDGESFDWIMQLLDWYPGHVIEFSMFEMPVGVLNNNTIIWEVRRY